MSEEATLLALNQRLLDAIAAGDWTVYQELCDASLTAFEPEAGGHLVEGLAFHQFYFRDGIAEVPAHETTMASPRVRVMGDAAIVAYVRLNQRRNEQNEPITTAFAETRIWQRVDGSWRHVHFHRSVVK